MMIETVGGGLEGIGRDWKVLINQRELIRLAIVRPLGLLEKSHVPKKSMKSYLYSFVQIVIQPDWVSILAKRKTMRGFSILDYQILNLRRAHGIVSI